MRIQPPPYRPDTLEAAIVHLGARAQDHVQIIGGILGGAGGSLYATDLIMIGAAQRSMKLIEGFVELVKADFHRGWQYQRDR
jgi:hypothetical protein